MSIGPIVNPAYSVLFKDNASISGSYLDVYGSNDTLSIDHSFVWGNSENLTGNYNQLWGTLSTITGHDNVVTGSSNSLFGDHNLLEGSNSLLVGTANDVHGNFNHVYGDYERVKGDYNQVSGTDLIIAGVGNTVTLQNQNGLDPAKTLNYFYGYWNDISDRDNENVNVRGDFNTLHISHSDQIWLAGHPKDSFGAEISDTLDFSHAVAGKSDVYGFNATDTIEVGFGETTTVTTLANGFIDLHIAGNGVSYDVIFHDGGADVAAHIVHAYFGV